MPWLANDLVTTVKLRTMLPTSSTAPGTLDADVLAHANDELHSRMVPLLMSVDEEYFTTTVDVPLVGGQALYRLPDRSAGSKLRELTLIVGNVVINLPRIEPERLTQFVNNAAGIPVAFVMEAGSVRLVPTPSAGAMSLRMRYYFRPGQLTITATDWATVTSVTSPTATTVTVAFSGALTPATTALIDLISSKPPFEYLAMDGACSAGTSPITLTYAGGYSPGLTASQSSAGWAGADYVTLRDRSPVVQLPQELHSLLAQRTACRVMQALGQYEKLDRATKEADRLESVALSLLTPRVDGAARKMRGILTNTRRNGWLGF